MTDPKGGHTGTGVVDVEQLFHSALSSHFPFAAWMKDRDGRYRAANVKLAQYLGVDSPELLLGKRVHDFFDAETADQSACELDMVVTGDRTVRAEKRFKVNGQLRWFDIHQSPVTVNGEIIGIVGCAWDITERKEVEQALAESEERYRRVVEVSPEAIFVHCDGRFVYLNQAAATLLGAQRPEDLYGLRALDFVYLDQREKVGQRIRNAGQHGDNPLIEEQLVRLDGTVVLVDMVSVYFSYQGKDSVLAIARDISERRRLQDELVKTQKLESLGVLAGGIAHDFNNILTALLGNLSLIRLQLGQPENVAKGLERCEKAVLRASDLTRQLLTFARGGEPVRSLINAESLINESVHFALRGSNVSCELDVDGRLWPIEADAGQVTQVLSNLMINARQAMAEGGVVRIRARNAVLGPDSGVELPPGSYLEIAVEDRGCGIAAEDLSKIFDPFFTTKPLGNGLGLASVYSIVKRHGGAVFVSSTPGNGSTFIVYLPAVPGQKVEAEAGLAQELVPGKGKILVMDDEEVIRKLTAETLELAGFQVETCGEGGEAVEKYRQALKRQQRFDMVIMDLTVPGGMGGKDAAGRILEIDPEAVLVVSSGYSNDPVIANYRQFGFSGAVTKPFSVVALTAEVSRLIKRPLPLAPSR